LSSDSIPLLVTVGRAPRQEHLPPAEPAQRQIRASVAALNAAIVAARRTGQRQMREGDLSSRPSTTEVAYET